MRLAVVSTAIPPASSGQARVLGQVLDGLDALFLSDAAQPGAGTAPLAPARFLLAPRLGSGRVNNLAGLAVTVFARAGEIARRARAHRAEAILGCSGSPFDPPAAWLAAERLRLPFGAWLFDDPVLQWPAADGTPYRAFARFWERLWARRSVPLAPNEVMAADFARRNPRSRPPVLVRNPAANAAFGDPAAPWPRDAAAPLRVLYTGSVYAAQADAVRNLVTALADEPGFALALRTPQGAAELAAQGIAGVAILPPLPHAEALAEQQRADILFLPLAFDAAIPEVIRSSAPAKAAEYLASGRPVLVHAPPGAYVNRLFHGAGLVVDRPEPLLLLAALRRLRDDAALRGGLLAEAALRAPGFRVAASRAAMLAALGGDRR